MNLSESYQDTLTELINIGYGRAAAALSELTGRRIVLEVPKVAVHPIDEVGPVLKTVLKGDVASVHQVFSGPVSGNALLLLDEEAARMLHTLLLGQESGDARLHGAAGEALTEVGNILLNACLGTFGNLLKVQVSFSVPRLNLESLGAIVESLRINREGLRYALVVHAGFRLRDREVRGYLVIVLSVSSLDRLVRAVENWEQSH